MATKPTIGIIGNGNVGKALTQGLQRAGYQVDAVGRDPPRVKEITRKANIVFLAVPFDQRKNAVDEMGDAIAGKTLIDVTNALTPNGEYAADLKKSGAEQLQEFARRAKVVKAFNTVFAQNMNTGRVNGENLTLFAASDDKNAKDQTLAIGRDLGFESVDAGPLAHARWLETLGLFNIKLGYAQKLGPNIGFRLVGTGGGRRVEDPAGTARSR